MGEPPPIAPRRFMPSRAEFAAAAYVTSWRPHQKNTCRARRSARQSNWELPILIDAPYQGHSEGDIAHVQTRALIFIEADAPIGLICVMPIGMVEISICVINETIKPSARAEKGRIPPAATGRGRLARAILL
jgi:hypothetical protein